MEKKAAALTDPLAEQLIVLHEQNLTGNRLAVTAFEQNLPGFSLMFVLIAVIFGTSMALHDERDWRTLPRLLVAPASFTAVAARQARARASSSGVDPVRAPAALGPPRVRRLARILARRPAGAGLRRGASRPSPPGCWWRG